ncbi:unnamed protein product [Spirodela intermedia]|uniref:Uncharacterized protein n=1 Tax=Spirodela intermedia TaxID=51605 RepID=A0A7I8JE92_SPIIN|nr:unnamed protein product [Spirodela intermedia]CAA6667853.1 unnamed protein product [Spirodela intermedia]
MVSRGETFQIIWKSHKLLIHVIPSRRISCYKEKWKTSNWGIKKKR